MTRSADRTAADSSDAECRAWRVLHACEKAAPLGVIAEAQLAVGMRPQILAREFWNDANSGAPSLMNAWHAIRDWRHALNEAEALTSIQIVHAHSFAAAMAAVRGSLPSVYDFQETLESESGLTAGPWMLRSFRVAEQFALSRAGAIVTHSGAMKKIAGEYGAAPENVFVIPEPINARVMTPDRDWAALHGIDLGYDLVLFALPAPRQIEPILRAFANLQVELEQTVLIFEPGDTDRSELLQLARELQVADNIRCITPDDHDQALTCADVVLAPSTADHRHANPGMLRAMAVGKAVVAADVPENRECAPEGQGVIWFKDNSIENLAQQAAFVARNAELGRSLGDSARRYLAETRSGHLVGRMYDDVYRHAHSRRRDNLPKIAVPQLYTANVQA